MHCKRHLRISAAVILCATLLPACRVPGAISTAQPLDQVVLPGKLGVTGSVQQVYRPGTAQAPSTTVPQCDAMTTQDCYDGPLLAVQAAKIGTTAAEPTIAIASDGTAYFAGGTIVAETPAVYGGLETDIRRSLDGGLTWESVQPKIGPAPVPPANADPLIYLDPATDRIFVFDLIAACNTVSFSDDKGASWTSIPLACGNVPVDHQTLVAVPPLGPIATMGYPNMLIWCSNRVVDAACGRSFDGGLTWTPAGQPFLGVTMAGFPCSSLAGHLAGDADGYLYLPSAHCGTPDVAVSNDGGVTWTVHSVSPTPSPVEHTSVATDSAGNVYYTWIDDLQQPFLSYSTDHGKTWSAPMMVAPPGVAKANFPTVAAGAPGKVALNFPTQLAGENVTAWDQTVVVSENVFAADAVFLSATANDPAQPIHRGACQGRCAGLWDFLDVQISKDGEAWASASFDCNGPCLTTGEVVSDHAGQGVAIRQIAGPKLR